MKYDWSKERIESVIADCDSLFQVLEKLNIPRACNNTATLRKKLEEFNIDYSHFTYGAKGKKGIENYIPVKEYLGTGKYIHTTKLKEKLEGLAVADASAMGNLSGVTSDLSAYTANTYNVQLGEI